jgi:hypothetical protein
MLLSILTHTTRRKEMDKLTKLETVTNAKQKRDDKAKPDAIRDTNGDGNIDKKLDGPNRPAE